MASFSIPNYTWFCASFGTMCPSVPVVVCHIILCASFTCLRHWHLFLSFMQLWFLEKVAFNIFLLYLHCTSFDQAPPEEKKPLYLQWAKLEEDYGLAKRAMNVYDEAVRAVPNSEKMAMYEIYIARAAELFGVPRTRQIYEVSVLSFPLSLWLLPYGFWLIICFEIQFFFPHHCCGWKKLIWIWHLSSLMPLFNYLVTGWIN